MSADESTPVSGSVAAGRDSSIHANAQQQQQHSARGEADTHVAAVAQQLRVGTAHAIALLEAAGGDPIQAIRNNLHLLGPFLQ
jgi:NACalpha-BTF3-like transcription factor